VQSNVKSFNRVRDHARVELAKIVQFFVGQPGCGHVRFLSEIGSPARPLS
jgi:hypothetical protein